MYHEEKKKAERASSAKGDFLAQMSHEMRTPMNAIIGMTSIAKSAADPERKDYCLNKISSASAHLLGVINDILDMSKIEANKFSLSPEEFDFEGMLQRAVNVINFRVDEKNQDLKVIVDEKIPRTLIGDDQRMAQVITNLLSNAVKFTPENGSIRLEAGLKEEKDGACAIEISVTDNGIGISAEQQKRLFTSFEQADNTTSRKFGGTGLGLAISKRIVEMMRGSICVESAPGKGSTFAFTVWVRHLGDIGRKRLLDSGVDRSNMRVLAVDDDPWVLEYFSEIMRQFGMPCSLAEGGEEAVKLIQDNGGFDLYFIDWKMPGIDGIELTRRIKEGGRPKSVVIMISAMEWSAMADEAKLAGVDKFLQKPLFPSAIADCINECLGVGRLMRETESPCGDVECFDGCTALLAEDVEINREIAVTLFEPTRLKFECAENGAEAVRMFSESPDKYDVILMDVQMPEMDGYEATRRIRGLGFQKAKDIPILAMTANVFRGDIEKCIASGMTAHIGKPIVFDEAVRKLRLCLAKKN
jgi:CheY-like chemotaxis protein